MVAHFTMRTHGVNQAFRFVEGIWLHRKSRRIRFFFFSEKDLVFIFPAQHEQPSYIKTMRQGRLCIINLNNSTGFGSCHRENTSDPDHIIFS